MLSQKNRTLVMPTLHNKINKEELKAQVLEDSTKRVTLSFYRYQEIADPKAFRNELYRLLEPIGVLGRIYVSQEGINAQVSVPEPKFEAFREALYGIEWLDEVRLNVAIEDDGKSFFVLKIKVRGKIVADGLDHGTYDLNQRGTPLDAKSYNDLTSQPETIVVDMRNHYESEVGYFKGAIRPDVDTFREALPLVEDMLEDKKDKPIIMYCTGGIRCEKASAYYRQKGFDNVFMVEGGIIEYTRQCREQGLENKFIGKNFVFDDRLGERITEDIVSRCHQCGKPSDRHVNCANNSCHLLFIQCEECAKKYNHCCSNTCKDYIALPLKEQHRLRGSITFNGSKFGKGRFKKQ
ncbi:MAG: rhodanese-related sulfurtransferase [Bacteroidota bacterium]